MMKKSKLNLYVLVWTNSRDLRELRKRALFLADQPPAREHSLLNFSLQSPLSQVPCAQLYNVGIIALYLLTCIKGRKEMWM